MTDTFQHTGLVQTINAVRQALSGLVLVGFTDDTVRSIRTRVPAGVPVAVKVDARDLQETELAPGRLVAVGDSVSSDGVSSLLLSARTTGAFVYGGGYSEGSALMPVVDTCFGSPSCVFVGGAWCYIPPPRARAVRSPVRWDSHFNAVVCIHYKPYAVRLPRLLDELYRVGLMQSRVFRFEVTNQIRGVPGTRNLAEAARRILDRFTATAPDGRRLLLLENDIAFLHDLDSVERILNDIPDGIVQLDKFVPWEWTEETYKAYVAEHRHNDSFFRADRMKFNGGSAFVLDRDSAARLSSVLAARPNYPDSRFHSTGCERYCAVRNVAVQIMYGDGVAASHWCGSGDGRFNSHTKGYAGTGLRYCDYAVPKGYDEQTIYYDPDNISTGLTSRSAADTAPIDVLRQPDKLDAHPDPCGILSRGSTLCLLLTYTGYSERVAPVVRELGRIGITPEIRYDVPTEERKALRKILDRGAPVFARHTGLFYATMMHYRAIAEAYHRGFDSVLICEDDIRFLRDTGKIAEAVRELPQVVDCIMYDYFPTTNREHGADGSQGTSGWHSPVTYRGAGCYQLSRRGMERMLHWYDQDVAGNKLRVCDHYFTNWGFDGLVFLAYRIPLCIQVECPSGGNFGAATNTMFQARYASLGIREEDYASF